MVLRLLLLFPKVIILCKCAELEGGSFVTMDMASDSLTKSFSHIACLTVETYLPPCPNRMHTCAALAPHLRRTCAEFVARMWANICYIGYEKGCGI